MTGSYMLMLCREAAGWLKDAGLTEHIDFVPIMPVGNGYTPDVPTRDRLFVRVGIGGYDASADMRIGEALVPFIALFHEAAGHVSQLEYEFQNPTPLGNALFLNHFACKGSSRYYGVDDNGGLHPAYFGNPHEIAAQYMGIKCATEYLRCAVGLEKAESWVLDYVRYRIENKCEFLPGVPFQSDAEAKAAGKDPEAFAARYKADADAVMTKYPTIDAVLRDMDREFQRRLRKPREFDVSHFDGDSLQLFDESRKNFDVRKAVSDCKYGIRQDAMMAVAYVRTMERLAVDSVACMRSRKSFDDVDLDIKRVFLGFGDPLRPAPKGKFASLGRLMAVTDDADKRACIKQHPDAPDY